MDRLRSIARVIALALALGLAVTMGAVFPVPPRMVLVRRRRTDRTELLQPARRPAGLDGHDLSPGLPGGQLSG